MSAFRLPRHPDAFSVDRATRRRGRGDREPDHLVFIRTLPCCTCGSTRKVEAAHIRFASPAHGKPGTAMAQKPADRWTVSLCASCHREGPESQHSANERDWWQARGIDPCGLAMGLRALSGPDGHEAAVALINAIRKARKPHAGD